MASAKEQAPLSPNKGINRVLLLPGVGHLATTTIVPVCLLVASGSNEEAVLTAVLLIIEVNLVATSLSKEEAGICSKT